MKLNNLTSQNTPPRNRTGKSLFHKALLAVAIISVLFNVLAILPYVQPYYTKFQRKYFPKEHFSNQTLDKEVLDRVCKATVELKGVKMSMNEPKGLPEDIKSLFRQKRNTEATNNFFTSYAMVGISYYAMEQDDSATMDELKKKADAFIDSKAFTLNYPVIKIDQAPIGLLLLNLHKWYKDEQYMKVAQNLFSTVKDMKDKQGRVLYAGLGAKVDFADALGMYVPFFMEYFKATNDSSALKIVNDNMERYQRYAVNPLTGIPAHGYNLSNGVPVGSANLMFEIYKQSKNKNRKLSLRFIKSHVLTDGFVDDCSGDTYGLNSYSHTFGESELCNGLLLMLASKFDNSQSENEKL